MPQRSDYLVQLLVVVLFLIPPMAALLVVARQLPAAREADLDGAATPAAVRRADAAEAPGGRRAANRFPARLR